MLVFLDIQHIGIPHSKKVNSTGAAKDLDNDGKIEQNELEAYNTWIYAGHCMARLRELGHQVIALADGWYPARHARVNDYVAKMLDSAEVSVYVSCHLNAGGGNYGAVFADHRSGRGAVLAKKIAESLQERCPELEKVRTFPATPEDWTKNAYYTIKNVKAPIGICFEPFFMDCADHLVLFHPEGLERVGAALAEGINNYAGMLGR